MLKRKKGHVTQRKDKNVPNNEAESDLGQFNRREGGQSEAGVAAPCLRRWENGVNRLLQPPSSSRCFFTRLRRPTVFKTAADRNPAAALVNHADIRRAVQSSSPSILCSETKTFSWWFSAADGELKRADDELPLTRKRLLGRRLWSPWDSCWRAASYIIYMKTESQPQLRAASKHLTGNVHQPHPGELQAASSS